jgi:hypothetical protein
MRWVPHGQPVDVAGHVIAGGMIYVGGYLDGVTGRAAPELINPELPVAPASAADDPGPQPAYHLLAPAARGAYLGWHAGGRSTEVPAGLVLLFCFGLERRVLNDAGHDPAVRDELPAIAAEVYRLRQRYARSRPDLSATLERLLDLLAVLAAPRRAPAGGPCPAGRRPAGAGSAATAPMPVRVALARFGASATPVPVEWAALWARHHLLLAPRSAQAGCPEEFDRLFALRYRATFGSGLVPAGDSPGLRIRYQPANPGLSATLVCREDLPDALADPDSARALTGLLDAVAAELEPYRRMVAQFPQARGSLAGTALLPVDLLDADRGQFGALRIWIEARFDARALAVVDGAQFAAFWSTAVPGQMARDEAAAFIGVLALLGVGVEPDVRFGAPVLGPGPVVLFRAGAPVWRRPAGGYGRAWSAAADADRPRPEFATAAAIARCGAALVAAPGPVEPQGVLWTRALNCVPDLAMACRLPDAHWSRLTARLGWLLAGGVDIDRLPRQVARLTPVDRELAGRWLVALAATVAPGFPPATVAVLTRLYRILGLDADLLFSRLHECSVAWPRVLTVARPQVADGPDEPVVVRAADPRRGGFTLPWSPTRTADQPPEGVQPAGDGAAAGGAVRLDPAAISAKLQESAQVAGLLAGIFDTADRDLDIDSCSSPAIHAAPADLIAGLDGAHSMLLRALAGQEHWTPEEFAALADAHGVLPDGALDLLNEVALDTTGGAVIVDGATLAVDHDVLQELLR